MLCAVIHLNRLPTAVRSTGRAADTLEGTKTAYGVVGGDPLLDFQDSRGGVTVYGGDCALVLRHTTRWLFAAQATTIIANALVCMLSVHYDRIYLSVVFDSKYLRDRLQTAKAASLWKLIYIQYPCTVLHFIRHVSRDFSVYRNFEKFWLMTLQRTMLVFSVSWQRNAVITLLKLLQYLHVRVSFS